MEGSEREVLWVALPRDDVPDGLVFARDQQLAAMER